MAARTHLTVGFLDKAKEQATNAAAAAKARIEQELQAREAQKRAQAAAAAERARQLAADRDAAFNRAVQQCPLPVQKDGSLPGGVQLLTDEFVVAIGKDWGWSSKRLALTTHRVIHTQGRVNQDAEIVYLTDIRDVHYRKNVMTVAGLLGMGTVVLETAGGKSLEGLPMASNSADIRNQLLAMVHYARERAATPQVGPAMTPAPPMPDKYAQLKQLAELREKGILTQQEFDAEKARLLSA
jgi:hypothetical protein